MFWRPCLKVGLPSKTLTSVTTMEVPSSIKLSMQGFKRHFSLDHTLFSHVIQTQKPTRVTTMGVPSSMKGLKRRCTSSSSSCPLSGCCVFQAVQILRVCFQVRRPTRVRTMGVPSSMKGLRRRCTSSSGSWPLSGCTAVIS